MNDALVSGAQVAQGFRDSKNPEQSAISGCYSICYWMLNRFYNGARSALHLSALVNGSGFAVTTALLRRLGGWHTVTMTEDYEFSAQCAMLANVCTLCPRPSSTTSSPLHSARAGSSAAAGRPAACRGCRTTATACSAALYCTAA